MRLCSSVFDCLTEELVIDAHVFKESSVSTLDDGQLKALLDEAINYKTPKDREGKSSMFKALLQEAEEDERNARAASASGPQLARYFKYVITYNRLDNLLYYLDNMK